MYQISIILLFLFFSLNASGQQKKHLLPWHEGTPLQWHHFKGKPDAEDKVHAAVTFAGIDIRVESINLRGEITYRASAVLDQQQSWSHPHRRDQKVLAHEQLHFDIAEVYGRKLERKLNALKLRKRDQSTARVLHQRYTQAQLATQARYDAETVHGLHHSRQEAWQQLIAGEFRSPSGQLELRIPGQSLTQSLPGTYYP